MMKKDWTYRRGDIYYADLNPVCGSEQGGKRPVVVIQNDMGNTYAPTLIVATITTKADKRKFPTHYLVKENAAFDEPSTIMLEQLRTIDKNRVLGYLGKIPPKEMLNVDKALMLSLALQQYTGTVVKYIVNQAVKWELIARNPVEHATLPKAEYKEREIWTAETLMKALDLCDDEILKLAINLAFSCSLRIGELLGLTWDCVDISSESIEQGRASIFVAIPIDGKKLEINTVMPFKIIAPIKMRKYPMPKLIYNLSPCWNISKICCGNNWNNISETAETAVEI